MRELNTSGPNIPTEHYTIQITDNQTLTTKSLFHKPLNINSLQKHN